MTKHLLCEVSDTRDLAGKLVEYGKAAFTKYHADNVADILKVISQYGNHGNHRAQTCNSRSEHTK